jgi:hypothetical protein
MKTETYFIENYSFDRDRNFAFNPDTEERTIEILRYIENGETALGLTQFANGDYALWDKNSSAVECRGNISADAHICKKIRAWKKLMNWKD